MHRFNSLLATFRTGARTVGLSPKLLGALLFGGAVWALRQLGILELSPQLSAGLAAGASALGAALLPPGEVAVPEPEPGKPSDQALDPAIRTRLENTPPNLDVI